MIEAFRVVVNLAAKNEVSGVLGVIAQDVLKLHGHVGNLEGAFGRMKMAIVGATAVMGGAAVLGVMKSLAESAKEYRTEMSRLPGAGFNPEQVEAVRKRAWEVTTSTPGANITHTGEHIREMKEILGTPEAAIAASAAVEKMAVTMQAQTKLDSENSLKFVTKAVELQAQEHLFDKDGKFDEGNFKDRMDAAYRFLVAVNGFVKPEQMMGMLQQAGVGAQMQDYRQFWRNMLMAAIEQGGPRAGTGSSADYRTIQSGIVGKSRQQAWVDAGLMHWEGKGTDRKATLNKEGDALMRGPGGVNDYVEKQLIPKVLKVLHYNSIMDQGAMEAIRDWIQKNESVETARRSLSVFANRVGMAKAQANYDAVPGYEQTYQQQMKTNPELQEKALHEALNSLKTALGDPLWDPAIGIMTRITGVLNNLAKAASDKDNQGTVLKIEAAVAAVAAVMALGGAVAVGAAVFAPLLGALAALSSPVIGLVVIAAGITALAVALPGLGTALASLATKTQGFLAVVYDNIYGPGAIFGRSLTPDEKAAEAARKEAIYSRMQEQVKHYMDNKNGTAGAGQKTSYLDSVPRDQGQKVVVLSSIELDKKVIARAVSEEQGKSMSGPSGGSGSGYDLRTVPLQPGVTAFS